MKPSLTVLFLILAIACPDGLARAQDAFAEIPPDESTPFFISGNDEAFMIRQTELRRSPSTSFPKTGTPGSSSMFLEKTGAWFAGLAPRLKWGSRETPTDTASLKLDPSAPVLPGDREVSATYVVRNTSREMSRIEFPTSQRVEFLTLDESGSVVDRWSDDQPVTREEGIVVINPRERIEFQEKLPTRDLKKGRSYEVRASLAGDEPHTATTPLDPQ